MILFCKKNKSYKVIPRLKGVEVKCIVSEKFTLLRFENLNNGILFNHILCQQTDTFFFPTLLQHPKMLKKMRSIVVISIKSEHGSSCICPSHTSLHACKSLHTPVHMPGFCDHNTRSSHMFVMVQWNQDWTFWPEFQKGMFRANTSLLISTKMSSLKWSMVVARSCFFLFFFFTWNCGGNDTHFKIAGGVLALNFQKTKEKTLKRMPGKAY